MCKEINFKTVAEYYSSTSTNWILQKLFDVNGKDDTSSSTCMPGTYTAKLVYNEFVKYIIANLI